MFNEPFTYVGNSNLHPPWVSRIDQSALRRSRSLYFQLHRWPACYCLAASAPTRRDMSTTASFTLLMASSLLRCTACTSQCCRHLLPCGIRAAAHCAADLRHQRTRHLSTSGHQGSTACLSSLTPLVHSRQQAQPEGAQVARLLPSLQEPSRVMSQVLLHAVAQTRGCLPHKQQPVL